MSITQDEATRILTAALAKAKETNIKVSVAVVDVGGNLIAFSRMDGAAPSTATVSQGKARTSCTFGRTSGDVQQRVDSAPTKTILATAGGIFVPWQGAVPIWRDSTGILEGACGVSGAASDQDEECARTGVAAVAGLK